MSVDRLIRINALLKREIGGVLFRIIHDGRFDFSAVTITRVAATKDLRAARVFVSIRGTESQRGGTLTILRGKRAEIQQHLNRTLLLKRTPRLAFELDTSLEEGDRVLDLLARLDAPQPAAASALSEAGPASAP